MRRSLQLAVVSGVLLLAMAPLGAVAQEAPTVDQRLNSSHPAVPSGWKEACVQGPDTGAPSEQCPVLTYNGYTYWAYSDINNDVAMSIVAYDAAGEIFKQWDRPGARYIWQITVDAAAQTVSFAGQSNAKITLGWSDLFIPAPRPGTLSIVGADAQAASSVRSARWWRPTRPATSRCRPASLGRESSRPAPSPARPDPRARARRLTNIAST